MHLLPLWAFMTRSRVNFTYQVVVNTIEEGEVEAQENNLSKEETKEKGDQGEKES
jgi:hypothetical protein